MKKIIYVLIALGVMASGSGCSSKKKLGAIGKNWIEGHEYVDLGLKNGTKSDAAAAAAFVLS